MPDENDPVSQTEYVLRRIVNQKGFYDPDLPQPVARAACAPSKRDEDGLSVFRELFVSAEEVAAAGNNPAGYYVARLSVEAINQLGLTVIAAPQPDQPKGHSLIPQLTYAVSRAADTKQWSKDMTNELAKLAGDNIVFTPAAH